MTLRRLTTQDVDAMIAEKGGPVSLMVSDDQSEWVHAHVRRTVEGKPYPFDCEDSIYRYAAMPAEGTFDTTLLTSSSDTLNTVVDQMRQQVEGTKHDDGKPRWTLVPWRAMESVVAVLEHGAKKYGDDNWRHVPNASRRYVDAAARHIIAHMRGDELDRESGLPHLAHAVCSILFLLENMRGPDAE